MMLYVVRHAFAGEHGDPNYADDSLRPLTKKGRKQFARLVRKLVRAGFAPAVIGTSPYLRCAQTSAALDNELIEKAVVQHVDVFAPGCEPSDVIAWARVAGPGDLAYVGHAPDVDRIASTFLGATSEAIHFAKGAIAAIEFEAELAVGQGVLQWLASPKLVDRKH